MQSFFERYRYSVILLRQLVITDFKLRYQGSFLGYIWSILRPLALFVILYIVFGKFFKFGDAIPYFPIYLLTGIVIWNYFIEVTSGAVGSIVGRGDLIRKINFPKYVIVLAGSFSALINLFLNFIIIAVFMVINNVSVTDKLLLLPLLVIELFIFSLAIAFFVSAFYVRFRDINYIWELFTQGAFYATPILYPLSLVPIGAAKILMLNPMAQIIQDIRYVLITPATQTLNSFYTTQIPRISILILVGVTGFLSLLYFRRRALFFAEEV